MAIELEKPDSCQAAGFEYQKDLRTIVIALQCGDREKEITCDYMLNIRTDRRVIAGQMLVGFCVGCPYNTAE